MLQVLPKLDETLIAALENEQYQWRTVEGLADELSLPQNDVAAKLADMKGIVVRSSIPDELGRSLYTTRRHYKSTHSVGERLLAALADRVA